VSPHDDHREDHDARVEEQVTHREYGRCRRRKSDHICERRQDIRRRHEVVLAIVDRRWKPVTRNPRRTDRLLAHRHASVDADHEHVEHEPHQQHGRGRQAAVHPHEGDEQGVARDQCSHGRVVVEPSLERDRLHHESGERGTPPVHMDPFEVAQASTGEEPGGQAGGGDEQDDDHCGEG
jgi:hypothetical protein